MGRRTKGLYRQHPIETPGAASYHHPMNPKFKSLTALLLGAAMVAFTFSGCNTTQGMGEDVEDLGEEIQEAAR